MTPDLRPIAPLLARLREAYSPLQVWLFGSRARGDAHEGSDWDLVVVVPDDAQAELFDPLVTWRLLRSDRYGAEVLIFPKREFDEDRSTPNTIPYAAAHEGILLDER